MDEKKIKASFEVIKTLISFLNRVKNASVNS